MDFDRVFYKAISEKFDFEESDHDFGSYEGWADYYATDNVPETVVNPTDPEDTEAENHSSITIDISDVDVDISSHGATMVPYGNTYVEYEPAGWEIDNVDSNNSVRFMWEDKEITREQYRDLNKMTDDELKAAVEILEERAMDDYNEWLNDNYEPPEPEPPEPDDYDPYW